MDTKVTIQHDCPCPECPDKIISTIDELTMSHPAGFYCNPETKPHPALPWTILHSEGLERELTKAEEQILQHLETRGWTPYPQTD